MRDFHLRFCRDRGWCHRPIDLLNEEEDEAQRLPKTGGAYVLGTSATMLIYPWGTSPIFYIGKAKNLRKRVIQHKGSIQSARVNHDENFWPRHQYGAAFGTHVAWYSKKGPENPQNVEAYLIEKFYDSFGAIPAANSIWPTPIRPKRGGQNE